MSKGQSLQEPFLNALRRERVPVSIYLVNGIKLQGQVESFDQFVVLLKNSVSQSTAVASSAGAGVRTGLSSGIALYPAMTMNKPKNMSVTRIRNLRVMGIVHVILD